MGSLISRFLGPSLAASVVCALGEEPQGQRVVFVHGFFEGPGSFWRFEQFAKERDWKRHFIKLEGAYGKATVPELTEQLEGFINDEIPEDEPFHLVGFSLGGIVSKEFIKSRVSDRGRVQSLTTLGSPHQGTQLAYAWPGPGTKDLRPGSDVLLGQQSFDWDRLKIPMLSFYTPYDLVVVPSKRSVWKGQENNRSWAVAHPLLLWSRKNFDQIATFIEGEDIQREENRWKERFRPDSPRALRR